MKLEEILKLKKECGFLNPNQLTMADVFMMLCEREDGAAMHLMEMCYRDANERMQTDP